MLKKAIVIGSGVAGMASAARLAARGFKVDVLEANAYPGGKLTTLSHNGYRFDAGPSLLTQPQLVDAVIAFCGAKPTQYFNYQRLTELCHYRWPDGTKLYTPAVATQFAQQAAQTTGADAKIITKYLLNSQKAYNISAPVFLEQSLHQTKSYLNAKTLLALAAAPGLSMFTTLHNHNRKVLKNAKLTQLFDRFATYNGSNPYQTPGIMRVIPHLEHNLGAYFAQGGMHAVTNALFKLGQDLGVQYHFNTPATQIIVKKNRAVGVAANGANHPADVVVSNADVNQTYRRLLPNQPAPNKILQQPPSSSALIFYWGIKKQFADLRLDNIFFSRNYNEEFAAIFKQNKLYPDPTVYINISAKMDPTDAPPGCENWFVMINTPPDNGQNWAEWIPKAKAFILKKIQENTGVDVAPFIETEDVLSPPLIEQRTGSAGGALYGSSSNNRMAAFFRHANFSRRIRGLYMAGGSVHPGGGVPLVLNSANITSNIIFEHHNIKAH